MENLLTNIINSEFIIGDIIYVDYRGYSFYYKDNIDLNVIAKYEGYNDECITFRNLFVIRNNKWEKSNIPFYKHTVNIDDCKEIFIVNNKYIENNIGKELWEEYILEKIL